MFEVYESESGKTAVFHAEVSPLLATIQEALAIFSNDPRLGASGADGRAFIPEKLFKSVTGIDALRNYPIQPAFKKAHRELLNLEPTPDNFRALLDAKQETQSKFKALEAQKAIALQDIESSKGIIANDQQAYTLAIAGGDFASASEFEKRHEMLNQNIAANQKRIGMIEHQSTFMLNSRLIILAEAENSLIERYRKKRFADLLPEFKQAQQDFLEACKKIAMYEPSQFYETRNAFGDGWGGDIKQQIESSLKTLPVAPRETIRDELLRAA
jgi:hypothetical protein